MYVALESAYRRSLNAILSEFVFAGGFPSGLELNPQIVIPTVIIDGHRA